MRRALPKAPTRRGMQCATVLVGSWFAAAAAAEKYALVVGVDRYRETELSSLDFADDDAIRLGEALQKLGFDVVTMTSSAEQVNLHPDAPSDILESLDRRLKFRDRDDVVVVSLSGHGVQLTGDAPRPDGTRETWFCPAKAKLDDRGSLLPISQVIERMKGCPAARKLLLVDACRNDMAPPGTGKARDMIARELDPAAPARRLIPDGMVALFSCSAREKSFERKDLGHSLFSYHVIEYLAGRADDPGRFYDNGEATLTDLVAYTQKRTARAAEGLGADQTPELVGRMTNWSFGRLGGDLASVDQRPATPKLAPRPSPVPSPSPAPTAGGVIENSIGMKLVRIEAGEFQMGGGLYDEKPIHPVKITKPFLIGQSEVTQGQFQKVVGWSPWRERENVKDGDTVAASYINWDDASEFCRKLTESERRAGRLPAGRVYRLPTEAEWEYACRAGTDTRWSFGDDERLLSDHAWWGADVKGNAATERYVHEVGLKKPNPWNLHDMHGNVEEWCSDWYDKNFYEKSPTADPQGPASPASIESLRVRRGGGIYSPGGDCRSANRSEAPPTTVRYSDLGFRVVCELE